MADLFRTGFGRADITPERYYGLAGFGTDGQRICNNILDRPMVTCVALSDDSGETFLLFSSDTLYVSSKQTELVRQAITEATGVVGSHVLIVATHTHAGPSVHDGQQNIEQYYPYYACQLVKAAREALEDMRPTRLSIGEKELLNMTFVRHYLLDDGTFIGMGYGYKDQQKRHLTQSDDKIQMIRFVRENAADIIMVNWQSHATITSGDMRQDMSADYIAPFRDHLEGLAGCKAIFFQGACGNLVPSSRIPGENIVETGSHVQYGKLLAEAAFDMLENLRPAEGGAIRSKQIIYKAAVDRSDSHLAELAGNVYKAYYATDDPVQRRQILKDSGFNSVYHAMHVRNRKNLPDTIDLELNVLTVGDISFASAPYEMFCSNGRYIKENTPYPMTFVLGYCNGFNSYIPDDQAFDYDCYEVNARRFGRGVAEEIVQTHVDILRELKENS